CLAFLADVLLSLHNFLYFLFISSDTYLFSFAFLFSFASTNVVSEIHSLLGRSTVGTTSSTASINIALIVFTFSSIFEPFISVCLTLRNTLLSYLSFMFLIFSDPMSRLFLYCLLGVCRNFNFMLLMTKLCSDTISAPWKLLHNLTDVFHLLSIRTKSIIF